MEVKIEGTGGNPNYLTFDLEVGGRAVTVHVFWEVEDLDDLTGMRRTWMPLQDIGADERDAIERWFHRTGLDRELPPAARA